MVGVVGDYFLKLASTASARCEPGRRDSPGRRVARVADALRLAISELRATLLPIFEIRYAHPHVYHHTICHCRWSVGADNGHCRHIRLRGQPSNKYRHDDGICGC